MKWQNNVLGFALGCFLIGLALPGFGQTFTDGTVASNLAVVRATKSVDYWFSGMHLVDLDSDGDLDFFFSVHGGDVAMAAVNDGTGRFTLATGTLPTSEIHLMYDVNEDGKIDLAVTNGDGGGRWYMNTSTTATMRFGGFTTATDQARECAMADLNNDGFADWVMGGNSGLQVGRGNGTGAFPQTIAAGAGSGEDNGVLAVDIDNDGDDDIIRSAGGYSAANQTKVYRNNGSGVFTDITSSSGLNTSGIVKGSGDYDNDGDMDIIQAGGSSHHIYLNNGSGVFTEKANAISGAPGISTSLWGAAANTDFDNDGNTDIMVDGRNFFHVLRGTGAGNFAYANVTWGGIDNIAEGSVDGGFTFGDMDRDGDIDLMGYSSAGDTWTNRLLKVYNNVFPAKNWVKVRPVGNAGHKGALGSKIRIFQAGTQTLVNFEEIIHFCKQAQTNIYGYAQSERHFGLNTRATVDIEVEFMPSGTKIKGTGLAANKTWVINENGTIGELTVGIENAQIPGAAGAVRLEANPNPASRGTAIRFTAATGSVAGKNSLPELRIYNLSGKLVATLRSNTEGAATYSWTPAGIPAGVYVARVQAKGAVHSRKILITE